MKNFLISLLDWIYKKKCYFCGNSNECIKMCSKCYDEMEYLGFHTNREINGIKVFCAGVYENNLQKLIRGLKYHQQKDLAFFQAKFMLKYWENLDFAQNEYQVIPVPLYKTREKSRKYNHMALVAEEFCKLTGYETNFDLIKRVKDTKPQYKLNKSQRMENLAQAFKINLNNYVDKPILLIDDICTTGSTFENIIKELKDKGIDNIVCFATTTPTVNEE